ncbi:MAG: Hsp20/alpha crystallin family protein [Candidatus Azobacteroides pseudotrichonymphae]|jgi:HSP20 family protein|uniref:Molecular chaperone IbpA n=1 Tax=Azobacteroides pseudotrichonymphae genomovar. CFP2 TaxID=511995 RepID=B6YQH1_AZOPC|nr:Hsp20/alpha crystallin family protein [Candidatus Azobacteroides pseudotrichonymphae]MDR0530361.1 Hsp20/alpha crystallin family protein [Bacteroidales bacterium OttesenSCG-928-I14]BAG83443.1 molecular chaperone IbpA [Candidatus Azobacteroides pseudotrichonymphae genomovar. CFP2]GMO36151.1 MAG: Hsp20/alpha crystallin family protein [Candidatus Azobacteroides pseudotrichonymphae]
MLPIRRTQAWLPEILLNDWFNDSLYSQRTITSPALNILERGNGFRVELAAPGIAKEDIKVDISKENQLVISVEKKNESEEKQERYLRKEFGYTQFVKTLTLPDDIDKESIAASYENGILAIEIPRRVRQVAEETKSISIS